MSGFQQMKKTALKQISSLRHREQLVITAALEVGEFTAAPEG